MFNLNLVMNLPTWEDGSIQFHGSESPELNDAPVVPHPTKAPKPVNAQSLKVFHETLWKSRIHPYPAVRPGEEIGAQLGERALNLHHFPHLSPPTRRDFEGRHRVSSRFESDAKIPYLLPETKRIMEVDIQLVPTPQDPSSLPNPGVSLVRKEKLRFSLDGGHGLDQQPPDLSYQKGDDEAEDQGQASREGRPPPAPRLLIYGIKSC